MTKHWLETAAKKLEVIPTLVNLQQQQNAKSSNFWPPQEPCGHNRKERLQISTFVQSSFQTNVENQYQSYYSDQSRQQKTAGRTNQNS